jgi:hypothetical protein
MRFGMAIGILHASLVISTMLVAAITTLAGKACLVADAARDRLPKERRAGRCHSGTADVHYGRHRKPRRTDNRRALINETDHVETTIGGAAEGRTKRCR